MPEMMTKLRMKSTMLMMTAPSTVFGIVIMTAWNVCVLPLIGYREHGRGSEKSPTAPQPERWEHRLPPYENKANPAILQAIRKIADKLAEYAATTRLAE